MSGATFRILKQCRMCGSMFEAQKASNLYCSPKCNARHYKLKKKLERKEQAELSIKEQGLFRPKVNTLNKLIIKDKEFLTVKNVSTLFECSKKMVYALIKAGKIKATNISVRKTYIKRSNIDKLFD